MAKKQIEIEEADRTFLDFDTFGSTGLKRSSGYIYEEWHPRLQGTLAVRIYREMSDNDTVIGAFLYAIEALIRQVEWDIRPNDESAEAKVASDFVQGAIDDMDGTWQDFISEIMTMLIYGWSYFEILYKRRLGNGGDPRTRSKFDDGRIGWRRIAIRGQESLQRWEIDDEGEIKGMWQLAPPLYKVTFLPMGKCILFRTKSNKNNPEGKSVLRSAYRSWFMLKRIQEIEAIGVSRNLSGMLKVQVPPRLMLKNASPEDKAQRRSIEDMVRKVHRDEREGLVIPSEIDPEDGGTPTGFKVELMSTSGKPMDTNAIINRYDNRIAMSMLSQFLLLGSGKVGSFALSSNQTELFASALGSYMDSIAQTFTTFAINRLCELNGIDQKLWPTLEHGDIEKPELAELASYISTLSAAGLDFTDKKTEDVLREYAGLPVASNDRMVGEQEEPELDDDPIDPQELG